MKSNCHFLGLKGTEENPGTWLPGTGVGGAHVLSSSGADQGAHSQCWGHVLSAAPQDLPGTSMSLSVAKDSYSENGRDLPTLH